MLFVSKIIKKNNFSKNKSFKRNYIKTIQSKDEIFESFKKTHHVAFRSRQWLRNNDFNSLVSLYDQCERSKQNKLKSILDNIKLSKKSDHIFIKAMTECIKTNDKNMYSHIKLAFSELNDFSFDHHFLNLLDHCFKLKNFVMIDFLLSEHFDFGEKRKIIKLVQETTNNEMIDRVKSWLRK